MIRLPRVVCLFVASKSRTPHHQRTVSGRKTPCWQKNAPCPPAAGQSALMCHVASRIPKVGDKHNDLEDKSLF